MYLLYYYFLIFTNCMNIRSIHIICGNRRKEIGSYIFWSNIVCICIWLIIPPYIVLGSKNTIYFWFNISPSIPVSIFTWCISGTWTLSLEYSSYWSPSTWNLIFKTQVIVYCICFTRAYCYANSVKFSLIENIICNGSCR